MWLYMLAVRTHIYLRAPLSKTIYRMQWALPHVLARVCQHVNPNERCGFPQQHQSNRTPFTILVTITASPPFSQSQLYLPSFRPSNQQYTTTNHSIKFHCAHYTQDGLHSLDFKSSIYLFI